MKVVVVGVNVIGVPIVSQQLGDIAAVKVPSVWVGLI